MEEHMKALEVEISYLRKAIEELKEMRVIEVHTYYTNQYLGYPEDYPEDEENREE